MTTLSIGSYRLIVKYLFRPKGRNIWHYRRLVPTDLRDHYRSPQILKSLKTTNEADALVRCANYNKVVEAEFTRYRQNQPDSPTYQQIRDADRLLNRYNLAAGAWSGTNPTLNQHPGDELAHHLDSLVRQALSPDEYEEWYFGDGDAAPHLPPVEQMALARLRSRLSLTASEHCEYYIDEVGRRDDTKFCQSVANAKLFLLKHLPDKAPAHYTRTELKLLIDEGLRNGLKTKTVHRYLTTLRAAFNRVSLELELRDDAKHPFHDFSIPGRAEDTTDRKEFSYEQLEILRAADDKRKPEITQLIHLMMETGMRVNEACGLRQEDVFLKESYPYVRIHKNPYRRLKTKDSQRYIPIVGVALNACQDALEATTNEWLFPTYIDTANGRTKNAAASAAVKKRLKAELGDDAPTAHSFRHTWRSRLRQVECPEHLVREMGGWQRDVSERYGSTADIKNKTKYLKRAVKLKHKLWMVSD